MESRLIGILLSSCLLTFVVFIDDFINGVPVLWKDIVGVLFGWVTMFLLFAIFEMVYQIREKIGGIKK